MTSFKLGGSNLNVLVLAIQGNTIRKIAKKLGWSASTVHGHIKNLEKHDLLYRQVRSSSMIYQPTFKAHKALSSLSSDLSANPHWVIEGPNTDEKSKKMIRLHGLQIKYILKTPISQKERDKVMSFRDYPVKSFAMKNHVDFAVHFQDFTVIVHTQSIIVAGLQASFDASVPSEQGEAEFLKSISPTIYDIERILQRKIPTLKLEREARGVCSGEIIKRELAYEHHEFARKIVESNSKLLIRDPEDGKSRVIVDRSLGFPEIETVHPKHSVEDMTQLQKNTEFLTDNDLDDLILKKESSKEDIQ